MSTTTESPETLVDELLERLKGQSAPPAPSEEEQAEEDLEKLKQRKPPKDGPCKRCGQDKPINRLMLCYPCWVKTNLEKDGWREGMPHPDSCRCEGLPDHARRSAGN